MIKTEKLAECVGLWLAEGNNKCDNEITFTNNCWELINFFHVNVCGLFKDYKDQIRIYVYSPTEKRVKVPLRNIKVRYYNDKRATQPYFIWRLASVKLMKIWNNLVTKLTNDEKFYADILRGFFAGEGNIKETTKCSRTIRIAQAKTNKEIEKFLNYFKITFRFREKERNYYISHKENWDKLADIKIADLHPNKKIKFWEVYNRFKKDHYKSNYLRESIMKMLNKPYLTYDLALKFNRTPARIYDVLRELKNEDLIQNFRVKSKDYWIRNDQKSLIISTIKQEYFDFLGKPKITSEIAKYFNVCYKSSFRRLKELENLGLIKRNKNKEWIKIKTNKKVIKI